MVQSISLSVQQLTATLDSFQINLSLQYPTDETTYVEKYILDKFTCFKIAKTNQAKPKLLSLQLSLSLSFG